MYSITKITKSIINNISYKDEEIMTIDCSLEELNSRVLPKLHKLAAADNLAYKKVNSNSRVIYQVNVEKGRTIDQAISKLDNIIRGVIKVYNSGLKEHNIMVKRGNKKACKPLNEGVILEANVNQYLDTFYVGEKLELIGDFVNVGE